MPESFRYLKTIPIKIRHNVSWSEAWTQLAKMRRAAQPSFRNRMGARPWRNRLEAGLYLHPTTDIERPDGCNLLLLFNVRTNWWARFGNGEPLSHVAAHDGLCQPGSSIINGDYTLLRLELLFQNWKGMIENGHWTVDENGVSDGIDKFKEADTEEKCDLYTIPRTW